MIVNWIIFSIFVVGTKKFPRKVALEVYEDIISRIDLLAEFPELGTTEPRYKYKDLPMRVLHSKLTRVFYCIRETEVFIVLLWNNRMDDKTLKKILAKRE
ncbi:MAG: type II toxin-antitoxin system RelE/ParE family toxin [Bacteroidales bacterium]|nr:type II toxin-antitoxin system RelE/ParE family toxin [Bacteroidales bacterium]